MKVHYQTCRKCGQLAAILTSFLSKEENANLSPEDKQLCHDCYVKEHEGTVNDEQTSP